MKAKTAWIEAAGLSSGDHAVAVERSPQAIDGRVEVVSARMWVDVRPERMVDGTLGMHSRVGQQEEE